MEFTPKLSVVKGHTLRLISTSLDKIFVDTASSSAADKLALIFEENGTTRTYRYSELDRLTNRLARSLRQTILNNSLPRNKDGDYIIAVSMCPSDYLIMTLLAIWKAGAAYLPLDAAFPKQRVEHILREAKPALVIFDEDNGNFINTFKLSFSEIFTFGSNFSLDKVLDEEQLPQSMGKIAIVLYTSGSTGVPNGVRLPHTSILNRLQWQFKTFPYSKSETVGVSKTGLTFVDSASEIWGPLLSGLTVLIVPKPITQDPENLVDILEKYKIERLVLVPSLLRSLLTYFRIHKSKRFLPHLKTWICSGETLITSLAVDFYKYFPSNQYRLCNFYGSTEVMGDVTYHIVPSLDQINQNDKIPIGLPVNNTIIYLLDSEFHPVEAGDVGELFVCGLNLAAGYVNGRDAKRFVENPLAVDPVNAKLYRTGDFARLSKGVILYEGRTDSQVKIRGYRVDLSEVEKAVSAVKGVDKAVVLCYKPGELTRAVLAFVTSESCLTEQQIEAALKKTLMNYMVPQVILVDFIPMLLNGKIDRQLLLKNYESSNTSNNGVLCCRQEIDYTGVPENQMKTARILFETIASVLNDSARSVISVNANFYEIGGNSLNSILTIMALNEEGCNIAVRDFITATDLGDILKIMSLEKQGFANALVNPACYTVENLQDVHKVDVISMITTSFFQRADVNRCIIAELSENDYVDLICKLWQPLVDGELSFVVKSETGKAVGVAFNCDARDKPVVELHSKMAVIFEFLESIEGPIRDNQLPSGKGKIFQSFMMATSSSQSAKENVAVMQYMEEEVIRIAHSKNFEGILATNTNPLTQQLASYSYSYKTFLDYQINDYVASDNTKPFGRLPASQRALVQWKAIN